MIISIDDFGAVGDSTTMNTEAIQAAIDKCSTSGGGRVVIENGTYLTGTIVLKSDVDLHIESTGVLLGSPNCGSFADTSKCHDLLAAEVADYGDYPDIEKKHVKIDCLPRSRGCSLIYAEEARNISITGRGVIDANGTYFIERPKEGEYHLPWRRINAPTPPRVVFFTGCQNVLVEDITVRNQPAGWSYWIHDCDIVNFDRIKILSNLDYPNNDGIHLNSSRDVSVSNATIVCSDDCLVVRANNRSLAENKVSERVAITNCNLTSHSGGIRIGWVNDGVIRNCTFSNLVMTDTTRGIDIFIPPNFWSPSDYGREATLIENLSFNNIMMDGIHYYPVEIYAAEDEKNQFAGIRNIYFSNVHARGFWFPKIAGRRDNHLDHIVFSDCSFEVLPAALADDGRSHGCTSQTPPPVPPFVEVFNADHVEFNNTSFKA